MPKIFSAFRSEGELDSEVVSGEAGAFQIGMSDREALPLEVLID